MVYLTGRDAQRVCADLLRKDQSGLSRTFIDMELAFVGIPLQAQFTTYKYKYDVSSHLL